MDSSEPPPYILYFTLLSALLLFSMFFSASEIAFLSASKLRIRYLAEKKNKGAQRVERLLKNRNLFLGVILVGNNIVNISISALITAIALQLFNANGVSIAVAVSTTAILIFGEILPKSVALLKPESLALKLSLPLSVLFFIIQPLVIFFTLIDNGISRLTGKASRPSVSAVTEEDIHALIEESEQTGLLEADDRKMMHKILRYTDLTVREIMIPRTDITAIHINADKEEILRLSRESPFSRFPVYGKDIDDIQGLLFIKDFLFSPPQAANKPFTLKEYLKPVLYVFETRKISDLQQLFRRENNTIALIIDEYGGTSGLVTIGDIVSEIFGEVGPSNTLEEPDHETIKTEKTTQDDVHIQSLVLPGNIRLDELESLTGLRLSSEYYDTLAGFILERCGDIPSEGTEILEQGFRFSVEAVAGNRIESIRLDPPETT